ncbi:YbcC family protein [Thiohalorhabdus methylotrophus]|uniref:Probable inorganic carbon transporter subunit DabA n=1 Tax=Thiohalorhabdus methylotrophus TaxID=3242694 RepID=A0ABV4TTR4_9GAMM
MTIQDAQLMSGTEANIDRAVDAVCDRIPPFWPLDAMVATNPYLGFVDWEFDEAAEYQLRVVGRPLTMDRRWLARQLDNGRITDADLAEAGARMGSDLEPSDVRAAAAGPAPPAARFLLYSDLLDERYRPRYSRYVIQQISSFCAAYYDLGQAQWPMPRFGDSLYEAWLAYTRIDQTPGEMEIRTAGSLEKLPEAPRDAIRFVLERFGVPADRVEDFLYLALTRVRGWASYLRHLRWEAELAGERNDDIVGLLAIRMAWEFILVDTCDRPARTYLWLRSLHCLPRELRSDQARALEVDCLLQRALEIGYQRRLVAGLRESPSRPSEGPSQTERPLVQAAFCIDVRSEVFRRSLETVTSEVQTLGFAGFFGVMAEYQPLGAGQPRSHLPVLLPARYRVCEAAAGGDPEATESLLSRRRGALALSKAWKQFKLSSASCFSFVESAGLMYGPKLILDHLGLTRPVPDPEAKGLTREQAAELGPDVDGRARLGGDGSKDLSTGIPASDRPQVAAFILNAMGLTEGFGRLVLLAGHGSSTVNNPHRAGLDCGACGGQTGEASVRIACALLNDEAVRAALASEHGIEVPVDTWFLPALHDTTTDEVELLDTPHVPRELEGDLAHLRGLLERAGDLARSERLGLLQDRPPESAEGALKAVRRRGADWAQVRPEWGLARNAAFIAAPRWRTAHLSLEGRAFLHEYDWRRDDGFEVLNLIMTAPMVVANWINLQYYGSTVDPEHLSAGNKVLHNVVGGRLGVLEGNGGDLRIGLAKQSLHDGNDWVHEPLRLSVFLEAPREEMDRIIEANEMVHNLVSNEWLHLFQIEDDGTVWRRHPEGSWVSAPEGVGSAAALEA